MIVVNVDSPKKAFMNRTNLISLNALKKITILCTVDPEVNRARTIDKSEPITQMKSKIFHES